MLDAKRVEITRHVIVGIHIEFLFWLLNSRAEQAELRRQIHPLKPSALVHFHSIRLSSFLHGFHWQIITLIFVRDVQVHFG